MEKLLKITDYILAILLGIAVVFFLQPVNIMLKSGANFISLKIVLVLVFLGVYILYFYVLKTIINKKVTPCIVVKLLKKPADFLSKFLIKNGSKTSIKIRFFAYLFAVIILLFLTVLFHIVLSKTLAVYLSVATIVAAAFFAYTEYSFAQTQGFKASFTPLKNKSNSTKTKSNEKQPKKTAKIKPKKSKKTNQNDGENVLEILIDESTQQDSENTLKTAAETPSNGDEVFEIFIDETGGQNDGEN